MDLNETPYMNESPPQVWEFKGIKEAKFTNIYPLSCLSFPKVLYLQKARDRNTTNPSEHKLPGHLSLRVLSSPELHSNTLLL